MCLQPLHSLAIKTWQWVAQNLENSSFFFLIIHVWVSSLIFRNLSVSVCFWAQTPHIFHLLWFKLWWKLWHVLFSLTFASMESKWKWPNGPWLPEHLSRKSFFWVREPWHWAAVRVWRGRGSREPCGTLGKTWSCWCFLIRLLVTSSATLMIQGALKLTVIQTVWKNNSGLFIATWALL